MRAFISCIILALFFLLFGACALEKYEPISAQPHVTIAMATYDGRKDYHSLVWEAFQAQDYKGELSLIVYENGKVPGFFDTLAGSDNRVTYKHTTEGQDVLTLGEKRNWMVENAKGEFIIVWDDDDFYGKNYVNEMVRAAYESKASLVKPIKWLNAHFDRSGTKLDYRFIEPENAHTGWGFGFAFIKQIKDKCKYLETNLGEDDGLVICIDKTYGGVHRAEWNQLENDPTQLKFDSQFPKKSRKYDVPWIEDYNMLYGEKGSVRHPGEKNYTQDFVVKSLGQETLLMKYINLYLQNS